MEDTIDRKVITDEFLDNFFPKRNGQTSEEIYLAFRDTENQRRANDNEPILTDNDIYQFLIKYHER